MNTAFYNSCISNITNNQVASITCGDSIGMNADLDFAQTTVQTQDCVFENTAVNDSKNDITQSVAQKAKAEIQNFIAGIIMAIAIVIVAAGLLIFLLIILFKSTSAVGGKRSTAEAPKQDSDLLALAALAGTGGEPAVYQAPVQNVAPAQENIIDTGVRTLDSLGKSTEQGLASLEQFGTKYPKASAFAQSFLG